ncbi:aldo/keto reductase [Tundrisphaera lichenicola]|uniref:aldo/keto reductase n=1 Tax=Tundrisphaera lichenicola TaxID=2029860 RepID=UPI003EBED367
MEGPCGNSRRQFLKTATASGVALASAESLLAAPPNSPIPMVTLGKTGVKVTKLGMGTSWAVSESLVQRYIAAGIRYIDTSESYERGNAEKAVGTVLDRTGQRKDVYLVTKNNSYSRLKGPDRAKSFVTHLQSSLERLKTDYVDCYYMHGISGNDIDIFKDADVIKTFDELKRSGKIRFAGFSCHDQMLPELVEAAAEAGWLDQMMIQYNFRTMDADQIKRCVDKASKANMGIVAMKTQGGAQEFKPGEKDPRMTGLIDKGFKVHQAAIKSVFNDERVHAVVSEMTNFDELRENMGAAVEPLGAKEARLLEEHRLRTANQFCHGCGHLCETAAHGVPVATVLRYYRYYEAYGKRDEARALYQALPAESRAIADLDLAGADAACPHGLPVSDLLRTADRRLGLA